MTPSDDFPDPDKNRRPREIDEIEALLFYPSHLASGDCWCMPEPYFIDDDGRTVWSHRRVDN